MSFFSDFLIFCIFYGVPEVREVSRKLPGARGFAVIEYGPVASHGDPNQVQTSRRKKLISMYSEMSISNWIFAPLVGAWRGDTLIQRSVSNASINKPGGMWGLSSTRDTISFDFPAKN